MKRRFTRTLSFILASTLTLSNVSAVGVSETVKTYMNTANSMTGADQERQAKQQKSIEGYTGKKLEKIGDFNTTDNFIQIWQEANGQLKVQTAQNKEIVTVDDAYSYKQALKEAFAQGLKLFL